PPEQREKELAPRRGARKRGYFYDVKRALRIEVRRVFPNDSFNASSRRWFLEKTNKQSWRLQRFLRKSAFWHPSGVPLILTPFPGVYACAPTPGYYLAPLWGAGSIPHSALHLGALPQIYNLRLFTIYDLRAARPARGSVRAPTRKS